MQSPKPAVINLSQIAAELGPRFGQRCAEHDLQETFVAENFAELRQAKVFSAGVPAELGGGGATHAELCDFLRVLAHYCGSTALALSMHTHLISATAWRWQHQKAPVDGLLKRVGKEELILISSGGSDWLESSGTAKKVEGGFKISGRKIFSSGCPSGDLLMTTAVYDDPQEGAQVLHFPIDFKAQGVKRLDTWHTMGMRGTGSHDLLLEDVFITDAAVGGRRPKGKWHMLFHLISLLALPLIYSVYFGLAEAAREIALQQAAKKRDDPDVVALVGEMENELQAARIALQHGMELAGRTSPGPETTNIALMDRTLVARHALASVDLAMRAVGGASFYRALGLERIYRDIQGARYHPLQEKRQHRYTGRLALGLSIDG